MCKKITAISNPFKCEYWINKGFSEEEALNKIEKHKDLISNKRINYWINKGFSEDEAIQKIKNIQSELAKKVKDHNNNTRINYWINKGFSEDEAKIKLKERQAVGKLERFIERYGEENGRKKWKERQIKWQNTLNNKFTKEQRKKWSSFTYEEMIKKYGKDKADAWLKSKITLKGLTYSKISLKLFDEITKSLNRSCYYGINEYVIKRKKYTYIVDFYDKETDKIIEFNGTIFHADPRFYNENDIANPWTLKLAKDIWLQDKIRIENLKQCVKGVLIIWEDDVYKNKNKVIEKCINFLKK